MSVHTQAIVEVAETGLDSVLIDRLKRASDVTQLPLALTNTELADARSAYPDLSEDDLERMPSWFAGVDLLRHRYRAYRYANSFGSAVAMAAVDWRRTGMPQGIDRGTLFKLARAELADLPTHATMSTDEFDAALEWACAEVAPWATLLRPIRDTDPTLFADFDAVTTWADTVDGPVKDRIWDAIAESVTPETALGFAAAATTAEKFEASLMAMRVLEKSDHELAPIAPVLAARNLVRLGRNAEAESLLRDVLDSGPGYAVATRAKTQLANMLRDEGRVAEAEEVYREVVSGIGSELHSPERAESLDLFVEMAEGDAVKALGRLLVDQSRLAEAEHLYRSVPSSSTSRMWVDPGLLLADLLSREPDRFAEAEAAYRALISGVPGPRGNPIAQVHLGELLRKHPDRLDDAEAAFRSVIGDFWLAMALRAEFMLATMLLDDPARALEAESLLQGLAESGSRFEDWQVTAFEDSITKYSAYAKVHLAGRYVDTDRIAEARSLYESVIDSEYPELLSFAQARLAVLPAEGDSGT
jgi:hypothetical protein